MSAKIEYIGIVSKFLWVFDKSAEFTDYCKRNPVGLGVDSGLPTLMVPSTMEIIARAIVRLPNDVVSKP